MTAPSKTSVSPSDPSPHVAADHDKILIVDFGSQVTQLIARRVREEGVYSEIVPFNKAEEAFAEMKPKAVILSGGPASVLDHDAPSAPLSILNAGIPVLGICYGEQTMAQQLGGTVEAGHHREFGRAKIEITDACALFDGVWEKGGQYDVWMSHGDRVTKLPEGFRAVAKAPGSPISVIADDVRKFYAMQFHPEVVHTPDGAKLIRQFRPQGRGPDRRLDDGRLPRGSDRRRSAPRSAASVICGLSGGVDSAVAAVLIHEAIGDQLTCVFVDHGMLRKDEGETVVERLFRGHYNIPLVHVQAEELFIGKLAGVTDPEAEAQDSSAAVHRRVRRGSQEDRRRGFPGAGHALSRRHRKRVVHRRPVGDHQVAPQCRRPAGFMKMKLVEPLRELFKDEVRVLGRELGLPEIFVGRHPFPGPGLAIRCPGEITADKLRHPAQCRCRLSRRDPQGRPVRCHLAGLRRAAAGEDRGRDGRRSHLRVRRGLRAVTSTDGMTADFYPFEMKFLGRPRPASSTR
jgi:GMP synthase (glutamine-hydrolysing)